LENSRLETTVFGIAKELRHSGDLHAAVAQARGQAPSDEQFAERFKVAQVARAATARYILREIEHTRHGTDEFEVEEPDRVHLEHIYPKAPEAERRWANHDSALHCLGNLTLLDFRLNTAAKNADFDTKKGYYERSEILMTRDLLEYGSWDMDAVNERQARLSAQAPEIWSFPNV
jgi:hypothetical protein